MSTNCWHTWEYISPGRRFLSEYIFMTSTHLFTKLSTVNVDNFLILLRLLPPFSIGTVLPQGVSLLVYVSANKKGRAATLRGGEWSVARSIRGGERWGSHPGHEEHNPTL